MSPALACGCFTTQPTGKPSKYVLSKEIIETLDMTEEEYYRPLVEIEGQAILKKIKEEKTAVSV